MSNTRHSDDLAFRCEDEESQQTLLSHLSHPTHTKSQTRSLRQWTWVFHGCILLFNLTLFVKLWLMSGSIQSTPPFTLLADAITYETRQLNGSFDYTSDFKGAPNANLDKAWESITNGQIIRIQEGDFEMLNKTAASAVFHQLHCLVSNANPHFVRSEPYNPQDMIRKFTYREYYQDRDPMFHKSNQQELVHHKDHCVDILRQFLMCTGDVGLITYHKLEGRKDPMPDFSTMHKCRKFDNIVNWVEEHRVVI
ncbi:hypothetical protein BDD12DRAFT_839327 [Trichophaea hybrida]|nr:hypothetical protein BDD12DRAFT_839327 [Trichophaea hybrida]